MAAEETTYYDRGGVKITNARVIVGADTYPMANITQVGMAMQRGPIIIPLLVVVAGLAIGACSLSFRTIDSGIILPGVIATVAVVALGVFLFTRIKHTYFVKLGAAGGERRVYGSKDSQEITNVVAALNDAIAKRG